MHWYIIKERLICTELNKLKDESSKQPVLHGMFWCPTKYRETLIDKVKEISTRLKVPGIQVERIDFESEKKVPPTFIESNDFIWPFQEIVNTYGVPQYKEVNPAIFASVTFPFLFGVMFGDVFHGVILTVFATVLCFKTCEKGSTIGALKPLRYLLLLMGLFSTYCGFIYNDFTSIPMQTFGPSCYQMSQSQPDYGTPKAECVYPVGVDPVWYLAKNELSYMNSLKMKVAVILGVAQMTLGVVLKGLNYRYLGKRLEFWFEAVPQLILLLSLFGFMDLLIVVKWLTDYS
jgi:V-type H+-transporting ATPase subunit a